MEIARSIQLCYRHDKFLCSEKLSMEIHAGNDTDDLDSLFKARQVFDQRHSSILMDSVYKIRDYGTNDQELVRTFAYQRGLWSIFNAHHSRQKPSRQPRSLNRGKTLETSHTLRYQTYRTKQVGSLQIMQHTHSQNATSKDFSKDSNRRANLPRRTPPSVHLRSSQ